MRVDIAAAERSCYRFGPFHLDPARRSLHSGETPVALTSKTFDLLLALVDANGELATREKLVQALWPDTLVEENSLSWYVSVLRKALGDDGGAARYIETVRGRGYRFIAPTVLAPPLAEAPGERAADASPAPPAALPPAPAPAAGAPAILDAFASADAAPPRRRPSLRGFALAAVVVAAILSAVALRGRGEREAPARVAPIPPRSVAVMPFQYLSDDRTGAYLASGVQDTVLTKLAGIADLKVIARASSERIAARTTDPTEIGRELAVANLLQGSVQRQGGNLLINVQLIDAASHEHRWAQAYERPADNLFSVESDVAERVADALRARLLPAEVAQVARAPTANAQAYDLFLKAEYLALPIEENLLRASDAPVGAAAALYRQAIGLDPDFALAQARLSYLLIYAYWWLDRQTPAYVEEASQAAERALVREPDLPQAHLAKGFVLYWGRLDANAARAQFQRALALQPNDAAAIGGIAYVDRRQGRWQESIDGLERAALLDPRNPWWPHELATTLLQLRRYADAVAQFDRALIIEPGDQEAAIHRAYALLFLGRVAEARQALAGIPASADSKGERSGLAYQMAWYARDPDAALAALAHAPDWLEANLPASLARAWAWELKGDRARAHADYENAKRLLESDPNPGALRLSTLGLVLAALGEKDAALDAGRRALDHPAMDRDAMDRPFLLASLADIHTQLGDVDGAIDMLQTAAAMPSGLAFSAATLDLDPTWDPLRDDPRFKSLVAELAAHPGAPSALPARGVAR